VNVNEGVVENSGCRGVHLCLKTRKILSQRLLEFYAPKWLVKPPKHQVRDEIILYEFKHGTKNLIVPQDFLVMLPEFTFISDGFLFIFQEIIHMNAYTNQNLWDKRQKFQAIWKPPNQPLFVHHLCSSHAKFDGKKM
jgi:hypothetical protein